MLESETTVSPVTFDYHPDYGYPNDYRVQVIECAQLLGVPLAAIAYNVGKSTIYKWLAETKTTGNTANN